MEDKTKKLNLEIGLFLKELNSSIDNAIEIDDETMKLLTQTILAVDQLQNTAKFHESFVADNENDNNFFFDLNDGQFQFRRHIVCCSCHDHIPINRDDFEAHIQKESHKSNDLRHIQAIMMNTKNSGIESRTNTINHLYSDVVNDDNGWTASSTVSVDSLETSTGKKSSNAIPYNNPIKIASYDKLTRVNIDEGVYKQIAIEAKALENRNHDRVLTEAKILEILAYYIQKFDPMLQIIPFGSTTYGFGGPKTNFNLLIDARKSGQDGQLILHAFEKFIRTADTHEEYFTGICRVYADRTMKNQLKMVHKESGIECLLLVDDTKITNAMKIIQDFITIKPICRHLMVYVRAWQNVMNDILFEMFGMNAFRFNTYIIASLVIFFFQLNDDLNTIVDIPNALLDTKALEEAANSLSDDLKHIRSIIYDFFFMFGERYQMWNHVMSCYIGRWQERRIQAEQKHFAPNQKRLREGIRKSPANWQNCSMYLQDLIQQDLNIAAEVTQREAENFQVLCQLFVSELRKK